MTIRMTHDFIQHQDISNYIIILGWFISPILNIVANVAWMSAVVLKKKVTIPGWLLLTNLLFLIAQVFIYFIFPL